jgi:hypothetical protein
MPKSVKAKSFAEEGLEEIMNENVETTPPSANIQDEGEWEQVGGLEPIMAYYQDRPYTGANKDRNIVQFFKGLSVTGTLENTIERKMQTKEGRSFSAFSYLVRSEDTGKLVSLSSFSLDKVIKDLKQGDRAAITCTGYNTSQKTGKEYPNFLVFRAKK